MTEDKLELLRSEYEKVSKITFRIEVLEKALRIVNNSSDFTIDELFPALLDGSTLPEEAILRRKVQLFVAAKLEDFLSDAKKEFESL